jgi:hypothetical protein
VTTLVVQKLDNELIQDFRLKLDERYNVGGIYPYIYMHNAPAGTFTIQIIKGVTVLASKSFDCDDIKSALDTTDNYAHSFHPVLFDSPTQLGRGLYSLRLSSSGYSPTESSFIGWTQQHEDLNNILDYTPGSDAQNPLAFKLKIWRNP